MPTKQGKIPVFSYIPKQPENAGILAFRFGQIFDATSTLLAGTTEGETVEEKMAKDTRSKTDIFRLLEYILGLHRKVADNFRRPHYRENGLRISH